MIVYALDLWHKQHLRIPTAADWANAAEDHPSYITVRRRFGSWNNAITAAGYRARSPGRPQLKPSQRGDKRLMAALAFSRDELDSEGASSVAQHALTSKSNPQTDQLDTKS